ncbi:hypothetical protein SRHO_G00205110 [Serrasalmus rhombeus]
MEGVTLSKQRDASCRACFAEEGNVVRKQKCKPWPLFSPPNSLPTNHPTPLLSLATWPKGSAPVLRDAQRGWNGQFGTALSSLAFHITRGSGGEERMQVELGPESTEHIQNSTGLQEEDVRAAAAMNAAIIKEEKVLVTPLLAGEAVSPLLFSHEHPLTLQSTLSPFSGVSHCIITMSTHRWQAWRDTLLIGTHLDNGRRTVQSLIKVIFSKG